MPDPTPAGATPVRYAEAGRVATVTLDQPANRNALTTALVDGLGDALGRASASESVRVVVLTHTGPAFCAGADLSAGGLAAPPGRHDLAGVLAAVQDCPKPVLGRILGHCAGGGVGLAAACDLSVAAVGVTFGFSEVRLGVAPSVISVVCLPKLSRADALALFLTGERFSAERAASAGLITAAVPTEKLDETLRHWIDQLLLGAPGALGAAKRLVYGADTRARDEALRARSAESAALFRSGEATEGMAAFRDRRAPRWATPLSPDAPAG